MYLHLHTIQYMHTYIVIVEVVNKETQLPVQTFEVAKPGELKQILIDSNYQSGQHLEEVLVHIKASPRSKK